MQFGHVAVATEVWSQSEGDDRISSATRARRRKNVGAEVSAVSSAEYSLISNGCSYILYQSASRVCDGGDSRRSSRCAVLGNTLVNIQIASCKIWRHAERAAIDPARDCAVVFLHQGERKGKRQSQFGCAGQDGTSCDDRALSRRELRRK